MLEQHYQIDNTNDNYQCDTTTNLNTPFSVKDILNMDNEYANYYCNVKREYGQFDFGSGGGGMQQFWDSAQGCSSSEQNYNFYHSASDNDYFAKVYSTEMNYEGFYPPQMKDQKEYAKMDSPSKYQ